jgi:hypothetical protein
MSVDLVCHAAPQHPPRRPCHQSTIDARWRKRWEPWAALNSHLADDPVKQRAEFKSIFTQRIDALWRMGISWRAILAGDLDSPMPDSEQFTATLTLAIERRKVRIGRVKGKGKKYAGRHPQ